MSRVRIFVSVALLLSAVNLSQGDNTKSEQIDYAGNIWQQETLTNGFFGLGESLAENGIELGLGVTQIYQQNVRGGISKHRRAGRYSGSYDLELSADLGKLLGIEGAAIFLRDLSKIIPLPIVKTKTKGF